MSPTVSYGRQAVLPLLEARPKPRVKGVTRVTHGVRCLAYTDTIKQFTPRATLGRLALEASSWGAGPRGGGGWA